jgi:hypothetical protein
MKGDFGLYWRMGEDGVGRDREKRKEERRTYLHLEGIL